MSDHILEPGTTCAVTDTASRSGLLIDGRDYYRAVYEACVQARRSILMLGWSFDSRALLLRGDDATGARYPVRLLALLSALCEERPDLRVYILAWRSSPLFALESEPFQSLTFRLRSHENLRFELDARHPRTASQHQKAVIIDRSIAFVGGMDLTRSRWDDRTHEADDARRKRSLPWPGRYGPYHDVQAYVTGHAVDTLRRWFAERWEDDTGERLALPDAPREEVRIRPSVEITAPVIGLARTLPAYEEVRRGAVHELMELHERAIAAAQTSIYIENQYFTSEAVRRALIARMRAGGDPLEIVIVLPADSGGIKEQVAIGVRQSEILRQLRALGAATGHHVGVYSSAARGPDDADVPVFIHAKVLAVDDRFLLVGSANATNRSMGLDSELGLAWEAPAPDPSLREARIELMREHVGLALDEAREVLGTTERLVARLDELARSRARRLRMHAMCEPEEPGYTIAHALREEVPLDPHGPVFEDLLPEPDAWFRHLGDRAGNVLRRLRVAVSSRS